MPLTLQSETCHISEVWGQRFEDTAAKVEVFIGTGPVRLEVTTSCCRVENARHSRQTQRLIRASEIGRTSVRMYKR